MFLLPKIDRDAIAAAQRDLEGTKLLFVSGPSGAGKSLFVEHLTSGRLPRHITSELPAGSQHWPLLEGHDFFKGGMDFARYRTRTAAFGGAIVHYDIAFLRRFALQYPADPVFAIFDRSDDVTVVLLKPTAERLAVQYRGRRAEHLRRKRRFNVLWGTWVRGPVKRLMRRLSGVPATDTLYDDPVALAACYAEWEAFVRSWTSAKRAFRLVPVEPIVDENGTPGFRLLPRSTP
jgi:hypothetical protein